MPERTLQSKIIPNLRSETARKKIPMYIDLICRFSSKPTDQQSNLEGEISKKISPYLYPIYRPSPKPPNIQNTKGERKWIFKKKPYMKSACRPPPKPPDIPTTSRILLDFDVDLNENHLHSEI